jgi:hypothetical protein
MRAARGRLGCALERPVQQCLELGSFLAGQVSPATLRRGVDSDLRAQGQRGRGGRPPGVPVSDDRDTGGRAASRSDVNSVIWAQACVRSASCRSGLAIRSLIRAASSAVPA